jgi:hypothetical protein
MTQPHDNLFGKHDDLVSFLRAYHDLLAGHLCEGGEELYAMAKDVATYLQPTFEFGFENPPTPYEIFVMIESMTKVTWPEPWAAVEAYDAYPIAAYSEWDPTNPPDDTDQYPDFDSCPLERDD